MKAGFYEKNATTVTPANFSWTLATWEKFK